MLINYVPCSLFLKGQLGDVGEARRRRETGGGGRTVRKQRRHCSGICERGVNYSTLRTVLIAIDTRLPAVNSSREEVTCWTTNRQKLAPVEHSPAEEVLECVVPWENLSYHNRYVSLELWLYGIAPSSGESTVRTLIFNTSTIFQRRQKTSTFSNYNVFNAWHVTTGYFGLTEIVISCMGDLKSGEFSSKHSEIEHNLVYNET